jgi:hypothetical protein
VEEFDERRRRKNLFNEKKIDRTRKKERKNASTTTIL